MLVDGYLTHPAKPTKYWSYDLWIRKFACLMLRLVFFAVQNQYAIKMLDYSYTNGRLRCNFERLIITNNTAQDRHLNEDWYILLALGNEKGSNASDPFVAVDFTNVEMMCVYMCNCVYMSHDFVQHVSWDGLTEHHINK